MRRTHVLVSGAGVAGATAAYWLHRNGFDVTVVERAASPRPGGQAVDVRGPACEVASRMGVLEDLRAARTAMRGVSFVDDEGTEVYSSTASSLTGGPTDGPDVEILRDDLTAILLGAVPGGVEVVFGDRITALAQDGDGVDVRFAHGAPRRFDVVLGADGAHSGVRALAFGPDERFVHELGSHIAVFGAANEFGLDRWQTFRQTPGTLAGMYSARGNSEVRIMMGFEQPGLDYDRRDIDVQKQLVADAFAGAGWCVPRMLELMWAAPEFYFDSMCHVRMPEFSRGRVGLLGDAGYCASPLSGQGTSQAMVGAYLAAAELAADPDDPARALASCTARMRDWVRANQHLALVAAEKTRERVDGAATMEGLDEQWVTSTANGITLPDHPLPVRAV